MADFLTIGEITAELVARGIPRYDPDPMDTNWHGPSPCWWIHYPEPGPNWGCPDSVDSHSLDRLVKELEQQGINTNTLVDAHLKARSRMYSETRYPQDDDTPVDRFTQKIPLRRKQKQCKCLHSQNQFWP
jgi:hypothetical protein